MTADVPIGERFSLTYLKPEQTITDSSRLRFRLSKLFARTVRSDDEVELGDILEGELGIRIVRNGPYSRYVDWEDVVSWEMRDVLCTITFIGRYASALSTGEAREYPGRVARILREEHTSYRIDEKCGVHPSVDAAYHASFVSTVRALGTDGYSAARDYLIKADDFLLPEGDRREAIRSIFDAVENVFKITFKGAISINTKTIKEHLRPLIESSHTDKLSKRTALKACDALQQWVDGCHNYRHTDGEPEPSNPPEELAVTLVAQGVSHVRWLADLRKKYVNV